jgi:putative redox protein
MSERSTRGTTVTTDEGFVVVRGDARGFAQEVTAGQHRMAADEPMAMGGTDTGPTPYDLLLAALGT